MSSIIGRAALALIAGLVLAGTVVPAEAQWGREPWRHRRPPGWGGPVVVMRPFVHPRRCWIVDQRVRVWTERGPRWRIRPVRVCR